MKSPRYSNKAAQWDDLLTALMADDWINQEAVFERYRWVPNQFSPIQGKMVTHWLRPIHHDMTVLLRRAERTPDDMMYDECLLMILFGFLRHPLWKLDRALAGLSPQAVSQFHTLVRPKDIADNEEFDKSIISSVFDNLKRLKDHFDNALKNQS